MAPHYSGPVAFNANGARKVVKATRKVLGTPDRSRRGRDRLDTATLPAVWAAVTVAIPPGTLATPSTTGKAQIYLGGFAKGDPVAVHNRLTLGGTSVAVDTTVLIEWMEGAWFLIQADCPT